METSDPIRQELVRRFRRYQCEHLRGISSVEFRRRLTARIGVIDVAEEGFLPYERDCQRDLSLKFHWGHNHDFGDFRLQGRMEDRHVDVLANFLTLFPPSIADFQDRWVFDVGCWTGGTSLLLASLGSRVLAIEEVVKYAETATFLVEHFDLADRVEVRARSLYECNSDDLRERFDVVYLPGVIYHLSDPLLALRILYNSLKTGGTISIESEGMDHPEPYCRFDGSRVIAQGTKEEMNRGGWNWFIPSPSALARMMLEAGFDEIQSVWHGDSGRVYAYGVKRVKRGICKAGLSVKQIP